jgi:acyl-coenzyme A synthetase/AMP-(fatty) acid ligase
VNALAGLVRSARGFGTGAVIADQKSGLEGVQLLARADDAAAAVRTAAGSRGESEHGRLMLAVTLPLSTDALVLLVAAILDDFSVCFLDPAGPTGRREATLAALRPDVLVDAAGMRAGTGIRAGAGRPTTTTATAPTEESLRPGYVAMSSGSTGGLPKAVLTAWESVAAFAPHGSEALQLTGQAVWAEMSHLSYDMAMTNLLVALASGATLKVSSSLGDRLRPMRFAARVGATHVRLAPRFVDLAVAEKHEASAGDLRVWASGGDRLLDSHVGQLFELGVPTVINTYGTSETCGFASSAVLHRGGVVPAVRGNVTVGSGVVGPWSAGLVSEGERPMLAIRSAFGSAGYLFGSAGDGYPRWAGDSVLTGDAGAVEDGLLYCLGRAGRRVKRNASFVDLDEVDATLRAHGGVAAYTVLTEAGQLLSLVEAPAEHVSQLHRTLPSLLRPDVLPERLVAVRALPRLGNGKVDQVAASSLAEAAAGG